MSDVYPTASPLSATPNAAASNADFEFAALKEAVNYRAALITSFKPWLRNHVLEVGAGIGQMSAALRALPEVTRHLAVEPDARFLPALRSILPADDVVEGTAESVQAGLPWDALISINVLEHIEHDEAELALYARLLAARQGHLCLFVPARQEIYAPIDKDFGHFRRYNADGLRTKLTQAGFEIVHLGYYNFLGYLAWWWSFCIRKQRGFSIRSVRFYDRLLFPVVFWLETRLCRPPLGQSLLVVARARSSK
jgi:hypothetical protein